MSKNSVMKHYFAAFAVTSTTQHFGGTFQKLFSRTWQYLIFLNRYHSIKSNAASNIYLDPYTKLLQSYFYDLLGYKLHLNKQIQVWC